MATTNTLEKGKYTEKTIAKIVSLLKYWIAFFMGILESGKKLVVSISTGNRKIGKVLNVSLAPLVTCKNCSKCKYWCYDIKACLQYLNVLKARARNTAIFRYDREEFFRQIWEKMARRKVNKYLRFHVSGEIVDIDHFNRMVETARRFPEFVIWTYTKMYWIVNEWIRENGSLPENFHVMFSEWEGLPMENPYNMPVFRCTDKPEKMTGYKCPGNCDICKACKRGCINGESSYTLPH